MKRKLLYFLIVTLSFLIVAVFSLTGCKEEVATTEEAAEEVATTEEAAEELKGEPFKVGIPVPLTGSMAADGIEMKNGAEIAIKEINESGGINGRPVEMVPFDSKELLAETFVAAAEKLILLDKVVAVVAGYAGETGPDTFGKYDVPFIYHEPSQFCINEFHTKSDYWNVFMNGDTTLSHGLVLFDAVVNFAEAGGYEFQNNKLFVVMGTWTAIQEQVQGMSQKAIEAGWEVVEIQEAPEGTREWSGTMSKIRAAKPSLIIFNLWDYPAMSLFKQEFEKDPWDCLIYYGEGPSIPEYRDGLTESQNGELGMGVIGPVPGPKTDVLKEAYEEIFGKEMPERPVVPSYDGVWIWANAARQVDDPTDFEVVCDAILSSTWEGVGGIYKFESDRHVDKANVPCHVYQVQNSKLVKIALNDEVIEGVEFTTPAWVK